MMITAMQRLLTAAAAAVADWASLNSTPSPTLTAPSPTQQSEEHVVDGRPKTLLVHRQGATRAFPPHHPLIPVDYQLTGQPVRV